MYTIDAKNMSFSQLNDQLRTLPETEICIDHCCGQRYIASGMIVKELHIHGIPGNALASYLNGGSITVYGNVQDAAGDTMNSGQLIIHGNAGDTTGYAMRGGIICIRGNTGYRSGIHIKEYANNVPALLIGGKAGSFLGEYQAGGVIAVFNLTQDLQAGAAEPAVGHFCGSGMHGGIMYIRGEYLPSLPPQVRVRIEYGYNIPQLMPYLDTFCTVFPEANKTLLQNSPYSILTPNTENPYKQLYTYN